VRSTSVRTGSSGARGQRRARLLSVSVALLAAAGALAAGVATAASTSLSPPTVVAWGLNDYGQLQQPAENPHTNPTPTAFAFSAMPDSVTQLGAGGLHSVALLASGEVWSWGNNTDGEVDCSGAPDIDVATKQVNWPGTPPDIIAVAGGESHTLALASDNTIYAWGYDGNGELGNDPNVNGFIQCVPSQVLLSTNPDVPLKAKAIAAGDDFSLAVGLDGQVYAWGADFHRQLGYVSANDVNPVPTLVMAGNPPAPLTGIKAVAAGYDFSLAMSTHAVWAWGEGDSGQLGRLPQPGNTCVCRAKPKKVTLNGVKPRAIVAGTAHALMRTSLNDIYAWGSDSDGQIGDGGQNVNAPTPVLVPFPNGVTSWGAIGAGAFHSLAIDQASNVYVWGDDSFEQQGDSTYGEVDNASPVPVPGQVAAVLGTGSRSLHALIGP